MRPTPMEHPAHIQELAVDIACLEEDQYRELCQAYREDRDPPAHLDLNGNRHEVYTALRSILPWGWK